MKKVLITGASGFVGGHLAEHLLTTSDYEIHGTYLSDESMQHSPVKEKIIFHKTNLQQKEQIEKLVQDIKPDLVFHLAAQANVFTSFKDPIQTLHANIDSQVYLLEALRKANLTETRVLIIGSSEEYGYVHPDELPIKEINPLRPANPYSVSKITQDYLAIQYHIAYKMLLVRVRPFNHIGIGQKTGFVVTDFAKQIIDIEKGIIKPMIKVGNLEAKRDFTDVRDMVKAYALIIEKGEAGELYNIGSGVSHKIQEILDILLSLSKVKVTIEIDQSKLRPSDVPEIICDNTKIQAVIEWKPEIPLEQTLKDILDYWRNIG
ncbi:MAG TPA: GDP-mannose 4,6-dehydratase [Candidatus Saccharimonadales bacterium]|nr:GDP-mannose 4,6-dehydratase [Candidatus Saccharimonadales bacterium]